MKKLYLSFLILLSLLAAFIPLREPVLAYLSERLNEYEAALPQEEVYLHLDKPFYMPGDTLWFQSYVVDAHQHRPSHVSDILYVEWIDPQGKIQYKLELKITEGKAQGDISLVGFPGGLYTIRAYTRWMKNFSEAAGFEKKIQIQNVLKPRLLFKLDFEREAYGPGDTVKASFEARNLGDQPIQNQVIKGILQLNGQAYQTQEFKTNSLGKSLISYILPDTLSQEDGVLLVRMNYKGKYESISRGVPILLNNFVMEFFPEGGNLVQGTPNQVAFRSTRPNGDPVDWEGQLISSQGKVLQNIKSYHQGMGAFRFSPETGERYSIQVNRPEGVTNTYPLPIAQASAYTLGLENRNESELKFSIHSPEAQDLYVIAQSGSNVFFEKKLQARSGRNFINIPIQEAPMGIARITLMDAQKTPHCERLVFLHPQRSLQIQLETPSSIRPREEVRLKIKTLDSQGKPLPAQLSLSVFDDKIDRLADDHQDNILSHLLMSAELQGDIYEPDFYFDPEEEKASQALDYVMMTHGWRHFIWKEVLEKTPTVQYYPEKTSALSGIIRRASNQQAIQAEVSLFELQGKKRALKVHTDEQGRFTFLNIDPDSPLQVFAKPDHLTRDLEIKLDEGKVRYLQTQKPGLGLSADPGTNFLLENQVTGLEISSTKEPPLPPSSRSQLDLRSASTQVQMQENVAALSEVVVVGYGEQALHGYSAGVIVQTYSDDYVGINRLGSFRVNSLEDRFTRNSFRPNPIYTLNETPLSPSIHPYTSTGELIAPQELKYLTYRNGFGASGGETGQKVSIESSNWIEKGRRKIRRKNPNLSKYTSITIKPRNFYRAREFYSPTYSSKKSQKINKRSDFRSPLYWNPAIQTNSKGEAEVVFYNSDALSTFRLVAEGISDDGLPGRAEETFVSQLPLQMEAQWPVYLTEEDTLMIPVYLRNFTQTSVKGNLTGQLPEELELLRPFPIAVELAPDQGKTYYVMVRAQKSCPPRPLQITFKSDNYEDSFSKEVEILPKGFPVEVSASGIRADQVYTFEIKESVPGSIQGELVVYPEILSELTEGVEGLIRKPNGCFEQTSSSTYPNILALQILQKTKQTRPAIESTAMTYIKQGYKRLIKFETAQGGFEWFGKTPPHLALTAYGLMEFKDMKKVYSEVSDNLIQRTRDWILEQRDGEGGFKFPKSKGYHSWSGNPNLRNAYVLYALSEAGEKFLAPEFEKAVQEARLSKDSYRLALLCNAAYNWGQIQVAQSLERIIQARVKQFDWENLPVERSIVSYYGNSKQLETTALTLLALMKNSRPNLELIQDGKQYILSKRSFGRFGSTQSTILCLKALTRFTELFLLNLGTTKQAVWLSIRDEVHLSNKISDGPSKDIRISNWGNHLQNGAQKIRVHFEDENDFLPYSVNVKYNTYTPPSSPRCQVDLKTSLETSQVNIAESVRMEVVLSNPTENPLPMTIALVGIPSGLSLQPWQLKELTEDEVVDFYEIHDNYLVIYYRSLQPKARHRIPLDLKADIPGVYRAPASSAYLYYEEDDKIWVPGEKVKIEPGL